MNVDKSIKLPNGKIVYIKKLVVEDFANNHNYEFLHEWLHKVNRYLTTYFNPEDLEKNKRKYFDHLKNDERTYIGAFYQEKIIGQTHLDPKPQDSKTKYVGSWGIAIHPDFQNLGLGAELLRIVESLAKEKGLRKLETMFVKENAAAKTLYVKKLGYSIEGTRKNCFLLDAKTNTFADAILIGKEI